MAEPLPIDLRAPRVHLIFKRGQDDDFVLYYRDKAPPKATIPLTGWDSSISISFGETLPTEPSGQTDVAGSIVSDQFTFTITEAVLAGLPTRGYFDLSGVNGAKPRKILQGTYEIEDEV